MTSVIQPMVAAAARIMCEQDRRARGEGCCGPAGMVCDGSGCEDGWRRFEGAATEILAHAWLAGSVPQGRDEALDLLRDLAALDTGFYVLPRERLIFERINAALTRLTAGT